MKNSQIIRVVILFVWVRDAGISVGPACVYQSYVKSAARRWQIKIPCRILATIGIFTMGARMNAHPIG